ncbi:MAG: cyclic nucleotide-binding domain-containing protein [Acidobacteriota bacterium]
MTLQSGDLRKYNYFSGLSDSSLETLSEKLRTVSFPAGAVIIEEGAVGDSFYFVKEGSLEVTRKTKSGQISTLKVTGSGQPFGEMALLTCSVRSSSVRAVTDVVLYELSKADFEDVILREAEFRRMLYDGLKEHSYYNRIKALKPFELLSPDKMYMLMTRLTEKKYRPGEEIVVQGEKGDCYFIIKTGRVEVLKKRKGEEGYREVAVLGKGDGFGEESLIRDDPRNATCRTAEETTVLVVDKKDFNEIMKPSFVENIFPEEIALDTYLDDYVIIDARIPPEYEEEHIRGAINIPIEILREKCSGFDRSKKYVTYCLNDSRGMVGAFLLKSRGFDAKCLRGGVSGWEGPLVTGGDGVHRPQE